MSPTPASFLVAELLRRRGRELLSHPELSVVAAEDQWEEAEHELARRLDILESRAVLSNERRQDLERDVRALIDEKVVEDWPTVALAMALDAAILTADNDYLGCGCPTWTVETLTAQNRSRRRLGRPHKPRCTFSG